MLDFSQPDSPRDPEKEKRMKWYMALIVAGIWLGLFAAIKGDAWQQALLDKATALSISWPVLVLGWVVGIPLLYFLLVFTHEAGHVVGAWLARFRVLSFAAGWLRIAHKAQGWKISFKKPAKGIGGMVHALSQHSRNLRPRYILYIVGGPLANLLTGTLALSLHHVLAASALSEYLLANGAWIFGWLSVAVGAFNLLPIKSKSGYLNDGSQLKHFLWGGPVMHQHIGMLELANLSHAGVRPRDWNPTLVEQFLSHRSNTVLDCYAHSYAYSYFHDCKDLEQIRFHLNEALDRRQLAPIATQQYLLSEAAYVAALHTHNAEQARHWLDRAQEVKPFTKEEGLFSRAAVAYVEGRLDEAETWLQLSRKQLGEAISTGGTLQAFECMDDLQTRIQLAQARPQLA